MQILFHLGAHCTDNGLLIRSILRNRATLAREGIGVPGPGRYRELLGDVSTTLRGAAADEDTEAMLIEAIRDDDTAERIILSNDNFLCRPDKAIAPDMLYPKAEKSAWLRQCLPSHEIEFAIALKNPATFLPELCRATDISLEGVSLGGLMWSDVVATIAEANPGRRLVVWCHEDTPFIWSEIMREITAHDPYTQLDGAFDMFETIISPEGMTRLTEFLDARNVTSEVKRRRAMSAFLEAHALRDAIEAEIDIPGWTDDTVAALTDLYEEDVAEITRMDGVTFIAP